MSDDIRKSGIELVAEGMSDFKSAIDSANGLMAEMGNIAQNTAGEGLDILGEIATGALRKIGELAIEGLGLLSNKLLTFVKDAMEGEKLIARLNSVLTATGEAAGMSLEDVQALATQFKDLAGGSDEAVMAIEEMALRMGTVSAEQMPDFIQTTLNLAAATGQDATSAARLLAQAYDDQASALARFNKMGIRFSSDLDAQIKAMVKSGDTAGAFALMMARLNEATKGAAAGQAKTLSGQLGIMQEHLLDASKAIGEAMLPSLSLLFDTYIAPNIPVVESFAQAISNLAATNLPPLVTMLQETVGFLQTFFTIAQNGPEALAAMASNWQALGEAGGVPQPIIDFVRFLGENLPLLQGQIALFQTAFQSALGSIQSAGTTFGPSIQANVIEILKQLGIFWVKHGPMITAIVTSTFNTIVHIAGASMDLFSGIIAGVLKFINGDWEGSHDTMTASLDNFLGAIVGMTGTDLETVRASWQFVFQAIVDRLRFTWNEIVTFLLTGLAMWGVVWLQFKEIVSTTWKNLQASIDSAIMTMTAGFQAFVIDLILKAQKLIADIQAAFNVDWLAVGASIVSGIVEGIKSRISDAANQAATAARKIVDSVRAEFGIQSPSVVFAEIGANTMRGLALGIGDNAAVPSLAAAGAASQMIQSTQSTTNYYNYSPTYGGAPYAPSQDFAIMQVMAG